MGFFTALKSIVSKDAWSQQYVENVMNGFLRAEQENPQLPKCAILAIGWLKQFEIPGCPVEPHMGNCSHEVKLIASFFSCLSDPNDVVAISLHALLEGRDGKFYPKDRFVDGYLKTTKPIFDLLQKKDYLKLQALFKENNPNGGNYCVEDFGERKMVFLNGAIANLKIVQTTDNDTVFGFGVHRLDFDSPGLALKRFYQRFGEN
jgi:hypothetical protein